jgi:hypothetical protein
MTMSRGSQLLGLPNWILSDKWQAWEASALWLSWLVRVMKEGIKSLSQIWPHRYLYQVHRVRFHLHRRLPRKFPTSLQARTPMMEEKRSHRRIPGLLYSLGAAFHSQAAST